MSENETKSQFRWFFIIFIVIFGFIFLISLFGFGSGMMGGGMMGGGWLFMLFPIIFIVFLIYALAGRDRNTHEYSQPPYYEREKPIEVLERRYASGEISRSDYLRMKEDIGRKYR